MIYSDELLFVHVPKTAGMTLTRIFVNNLKGDVFVTVPKGHESGGGKATVINGPRHATLNKARIYFDSIGRELGLFEIIIAVIRNPYDMEFSRFHYLRKQNNFDKGDSQDLAVKGDFEEFVRKSEWWFKDISEYYTVDGEIPENMKILRFESLASDFALHCRPYLDRDVGLLPVINKSDKSNHKMMLTEKIEGMIYDKYKWIFDSGFYVRRKDF